MSYSPWMAHNFGISGGLNIIGTGGIQLSDGKNGVLFSAGYMLIVHHVLDFPSEANQVTLVKVGHETSIAVDSTVSDCSEDVLTLPQAARSCILSEDFDLNYIYRQPDCVVSCVRNHIYEKCGCHPYYLPYPKSGQPMRNCTAMDAVCNC